MKSFEITEEQLKNLDMIAATMLQDETDPRSIHYRRILVRPRINWAKLLLVCILFPLSAAAVYGLLRFFQLGQELALAVSIGYFVLLILVHLKRAAICSIRIYQRFAPTAIRNKCRFEPSCSEYFILSLEKYGLIKGMRKGLNRLTRCNIHNGGFDYP